MHVTIQEAPLLMEWSKTKPVPPTWAEPSVLERHRNVENNERES